MPLLILAIIILWIWAEVATFIAVADAIGILPGLLGVVVTAMFGMWLLRRQGRGIAEKIQTQMGTGQPPVGSLVIGISMVIGAVLMLIPGYLSDVIGLMMFVPGLRAVIGAFILAVMASRAKGAVHFGPGFGGRAPGGRPGGPAGRGRGPGGANDEDVIDGDYTERPDPKREIDRDDT